MMTNSVVPMAKALRASMSSERGIEGSFTAGAEFFGDGLDKRLDHVFIAAEKVPLPGFLAADQACALQGGQVCRHGGLRQAAALVDLAGADAVLVVVHLLGELHFRVFQPVENVSPYWVCQGFYYFVEVNGHGRARCW